MNVELLREVAKKIAESSGLFDMDTFGNPNSCGTAHCIGGWAQVLAGNPPTRHHYPGAEALGLDVAQAARLFYPDAWPEQFYDEAKYPNWSDIPADIAVKRIEHFIATDGAE